MIAVALRNLRYRPGSFVATSLSAFLGATLLMAFAALLDTARAAGGTSGDSLTTTAAVGGGWCLIIVAFAVTSTLSLAVRQRAGQFILLRRIGATSTQLRNLIVGEAVVVALLASAVAVPVGYLAGRVLLDLMTNTGQVAGSVGYTFGPIALGAGFGVTILGSAAAGIATARRTTGPRAASPRTGKPGRPRLRRIAAVVFLLAGANCAVLTATLMDGKGVDAMQTAGQAGIWASIGLALLAPELLRWSTAVFNRPFRAFGVVGELATMGGRHAAGAVMPVLLFTGTVTGTVYMQGIEDRASRGRIEPDYAQDVKTLNYVVIGMITLFVAIMLVNTLIAATVHRRGEFARQRLAGATRGQIMAMIGLEGFVVMATGIAGGTVASLFTILPFGAARAGRWLPQATLLPYAVIIATVAALTGATMAGATRHTMRGPATT